MWLYPFKRHRHLITVNLLTVRGLHFIWYDSTLPFSSGVSDGVTVLEGKVKIKVHKKYTDL